jgi:CHASE3 domain sensor protein
MLKGSPIRLILGASLVVALILIGFSFALHNIQRLDEDASWVTHTQEVIGEIASLLSVAQDAETGQRGYLITGENRYLAPYDDAVAAIHRRVERLETLTADNPTQQARFPELRTFVAALLATLSQGIEVRRNTGFEAAQDLILTDRGKKEMDAVRAVVAEMTAQ